MGRGKGALARRDLHHDLPMVGRRPFMDILHAVPPALSNNTPPINPAPFHRPSSARPPPYKRPRTISPPPPPDPTDLPPLNDPSVTNLLYHPSRLIDLDKLGLSPSYPRALARIHIPAEHLIISNPAIKGRHLWGSPAGYTDDSDLVAILLQTGHFAPSLGYPDWLDYLTVTVSLARHVRDVSPPFTGRLLNGIESRSWGSRYDGARLHVLDTVAMRDGKPVALSIPRCVEHRVRTPRLIPWNAPGPTVAPSEVPGSPDRAGQSIQPSSSRPPSPRPAQPTQPSNRSLLPFVEPANMLRARSPEPPAKTGTGQSAETTGSEPVTRVMLETCVTFNMLNEPCLPYDLKELTTLASDSNPHNRILRAGEVVYVENDDQRFEISPVFAEEENGGEDSDVQPESQSKLRRVRIARVLPHAIRMIRMKKAGFDLSGDDDDAGDQTVARKDDGDSGGREPNGRAELGEKKGGQSRKRKTPSSEGLTTVPLAECWLDVIVPECRAADICWDTNGFSIDRQWFRVTKMSFTKITDAD